QLRADVLLLVALRLGPGLVERLLQILAGLRIDARPVLALPGELDDVLREDLTADEAPRLAPGRSSAVPVPEHQRCWRELGERKRVALDVCLECRLEVVVSVRRP